MKELLDKADAYIEQVNELVEDGSYFKIVRVPKGMHIWVVDDYTDNIIRNRSFKEDSEE